MLREKIMAKKKVKNGLEDSVNGKKLYQYLVLGAASALDYIRKDLTRISVAHGASNFSNEILANENKSKIMQEPFLCIGSQKITGLQKFGVDVHTKFGLSENMQCRGITLFPLLVHYEGPTVTLTEVKSKLATNLDKNVHVALLNMCEVSDENNKMLLETAVLTTCFKPESGSKYVDPSADTVILDPEYTRLEDGTLFLRVLDNDKKTIIFDSIRIDNYQESVDWSDTYAILNNQNIKELNIISCYLGAVSQMSLLIHDLINGEAKE